MLTNSAGDDEAEEETAAETLHCSYFAVVVCPELRDGLESGKDSLCRALPRTPRIYFAGKKAITRLRPRENQR